MSPNNSNKINFDAVLSPLKHDWNGRFSRKGKKKTDAREYLPFWENVLITFYITFLLATDFILFAGSGNIEVFHHSFFPVPEISAILICFFVFSGVVTFLVRKRIVLKYLMVSFFSLGFIYALYQQFYQFKQFTTLGEWTIPTSIIVGIIFAGLTYAVFSQSKMLYKVIWVLATAVLFFQIYVRYMRHMEPHEFVESYNKQQIKNDKAKRFIYFMFPNLVSYSYISGINSNEAYSTRNIIQGFYQKNKFNIYPRAYTSDDEYLSNMVSSLNLISNKAPKTYVLNNRLLSEYWRFYNLRNEHVKLNKNELYNVFKKNNFQISAYKSRDFDMCQVQHKYNVDRCIEKINQPTNIYSLDLSPISKINILTVEWLSSMKLLKNMSSLYNILNTVANADKIPMIGVNYNNLYVVNSIKTFDILFENIQNDSGKQAYFVFADIPSDMYIYDEFCRLKPKDEWLDMANLPWIKKDYTKERQNAYLQQTKCLYGKLEQFITKLRHENLWNDTVIVIQGVSGVNNFQNYKENDYFKNFMGNRSVNFAIHDTKTEESTVHNEFCSINDILIKYLFHQDRCSQLAVHNQTILKIKRHLNKLMANIKDNHIGDFEKWYKEWAQINNSNVVLDADIIGKTSDDNLDDFGIEDLNVLEDPNNLNPEVFKE